MHDHLIAWLAGVVAGAAAAVVVGFATRFRLLPEVVDLNLILLGSGLGGLTAACVAAILRFSPDRLGRLVLLGNLVGALVGVFVLVVGLAIL